MNQAHVADCDRLVIALRFAERPRIVADGCAHGRGGLRKRLPPQVQVARTHVRSVIELRLEQRARFQRAQELAVG